MGMINCRECGESVSSSASKCPKCGIDTPDNTKNILKIIGGWIIVIMVGFVIYNWPEDEESSPLPPPPIEMGKRDAFTSDSLVAIIDNTSDDILHNVKISLYSREGEFIKRNNIPEILPTRNFEVGPLEDWHFLSGYSIKVEIEGYAAKTWKF